MKAVSVVVPCYNAALYLEKCILQLLHQTIGMEKIEIILVNDASTDDGATWKMIREYEQQYPETVLAITLDQNMRQGGARNIGVAYATGEYIMFCDADDWLLEEALEHCYCAAKRYDADVVEFLIKNVEDFRVQISEIEKGNEDILINIDTDEERKNFLISADNRLSLGSQKKLYRRSMIQENHIQFIEHCIFEEPSFLVPVRMFERRHYFLDEALYICFLSPSSSMRGKWGEHKWDNPKVWLHLLNDMEERGLLQKYYPELEFLFFRWGFGLSIRMALQKGYVLSKEELLFLINIVTERFPDVSQNKYLQEYKDTWDELIMTLLQLEITDESTVVVNEILRKYA